MAKTNDERRQDLGGPEEEALEQHVREMLDITVPDPPDPETSKETKIEISEPEAAPKETAKKSKTSVPITVTHDEGNSEPTAPEPAPDPALVAAIEEANKQLAAQQELTAPPVPSTSKSKKVKIEPIHIEEETAEVPEPTPETSGEQTAPELPTTDVIDETTDTTGQESAEPEPSSEEPAKEAEVPETSEESPLEETIESKETDAAVTDIIATESDEILAIEDEKAGQAATVVQKQHKIRRPNIFKRWLHSSGARWVTGLVLFFTLIGLAVTPTTRYYALNAVGVRSSASIVVMDQSTFQPLKNVKVSLAGQTGQTDVDGKVRLQKLRLGPTELVIEKRAFAAARQLVTIGWGSNPLQDVSLRPVGNQYTFTVTDFLSGKPVSTAEAILGESNASANDSGEIKLTLDQNDEKQVKVQIKAEGYRESTIDLNLTNKQNLPVTLVPSHKIAFMSKRSGKYDVYKVDVDGQNEQLVLAGTGNERESNVLASHPTDDVAILVSTRDSKRDEDGFLLSSLTFINLKDNTTKTVAGSQQIHVVDWIGTRLIYVQIASGSSASSPQRHKLMSYDYTSGDNRQLAAANYFNDVLSARGKIYYAPSNAFQKGVNQGMFSVHADGSGKQAVFNQEVWNMFRTSYEHIILAVQQDWYDYKIGETSPTRLDGQPGNVAGRVYIDSPDGKHSLWIDNRDGKGTLLVYDTQNNSEKTLHAQSGLKGPIRWISNTALVFRINTDQETADYVVSIDGGSPRKVRDVTNSAGIDRWYYY